MSASKAIKLAPTAILLAFLGYASYSLKASLPGAAQEHAELTKGFDLMLRDLVTTGREETAELSKLRNPFLAVTPPAPEAPEPDPSAAPDSDPLAEVVAGLTLDATFLQGRDQIAIINGRIYNKGQSLSLPATGGEALPPLSVLFVRPTGVLLRGGGRNYLLGYPEQFIRKPEAAAGEADPAVADPAGQSAMFQRLLNSPLGALGKSLIGDAVSSKRPGGSRPRGRAKKSGSRPSSPASQ